MKKLLISSMAVASLFAAPSTQDLQKQITDLQKQLKELKANQSNIADNLQSVKRAHYEDHINFHYDIRTSLDYLHYEMKSGKTYNNDILSNRVRLTGIVKPSDNLKATLQLEANNVFGMNGNTNATTLGNDNSNATASETPDDTNVRVKEAYFNYFFGDEGQYMFSAGRRPSVGGYPANLRNNDTATSPIAHLVNLEFDGFSFLMNTGAMGSWGENYGANLKFCFGRGYSSNTGKFSTKPAYSEGDLPNSDLGGFVLTPYNDDQYSVVWENIWAANVDGYQGTTFTNVGNYFGSNIIFKANGIGDDGFSTDWMNDFMDDTKAFVSLAYTKTDPDSGKKMLGSSDSKSGYSVWIGGDMDGFGDNDRWGLNVVHGSKYFRPMTYSEDTLAGSIAAVRGTAFDVYYNKTLIEHLTVNLRATYLDYDYAGSEAFFGDNGNPDQNDYVEKATDIRAYIRYQF